MHEPGTLTIAQILSATSVRRGDTLQEIAMLSDARGVKKFYISVNVGWRERK